MGWIPLKDLCAVLSAHREPLTITHLSPFEDSLIVVDRKVGVKYLLQVVMIPRSLF